VSTTTTTIGTIATTDHGQLAKLTPGIWTVDASHTNVGFTVRHLMVSKVRGRFGTFAGVVTIAENPLESTVEATVDTTSITTNDEGRDQHLRSADFFDIENHPTMALRSTGLEQRGSDFLLRADLTIRGITRRVELDLEFDGVEKDPWGGTRAGFTASTEISRKDFGLEWNAALETGGVVVGDKVKILIEAELIKSQDDVVSDTAEET
jgi:polyisoprenoid-binding protein YceI